LDDVDALFDEIEITRHCDNVSGLTLRALADRPRHTRE